MCYLFMKYFLFSYTLCVEIAIIRSIYLLHLCIYYELVSLKKGGDYLSRLH